MIELIFLIAGVYLGWNLPQPEWAKALQDRAVRAFRDMTAKKTG